MDNNQYSEKFAGFEDYSKAHSSALLSAEFEAILNDVQLAVNRGAPIRVVYRWCCEKHLFSGSLASFHGKVKKFDIHVQTSEEKEKLIQAERERKLLSKS